jgi:methanogenic corrinoid protein MtbC1
MSEVGQRMEVQEFSVPEVLIVARAMPWGLGMLKPRVMRPGSAFGPG